MDIEGWSVTVHGITESDMTKATLHTHTHTHTHTLVSLYLITEPWKDVHSIQHPDLLGPKKSVPHPPPSCHAQTFMMSLLSLSSLLGVCVTGSQC